MFIQVRLLKGWRAPIWYSVLQGSEELEVGTLVEVPFQKQNLAAVIIELHQFLPSSVTFDVRCINAIQAFPEDARYKKFIKKVASFYGIESLHFYKRVKSFLKAKKESPERVQDFEVGVPFVQPVLSGAQQAVVDYLLPFITKPLYKPVLLYGVTGSGKTEVYKKLILASLEQKKTVIYLLPEVSLCLQFQALLSKQLSNMAILGFSSASSGAEKKQVWNKLVLGEPCVIIGVHLPIMLPIKNLGLIIVDEEHESGFCEKKHPKINSKEVALWRAQEYGIPIVLGSATPSILSLYNAKTYGWKIFKLKDRFSGSFPEVEIVSLLQHKQYRKSFWITKKLEKAIEQQLFKKEQTLIFLNRRGFSFFVQCRGCGFTFECPQCSVSLTLHIPEYGIGGADELRCHYCSLYKKIPACCPECSAPAQDLLKKGIGTQQVVAILQQLFPQARIERADADTTAKKKSWQQTVADFEKGEIDILVGTQSITKGYHFPNITLVGIIWADLNLNFPFFNAQEVALQQLIQVAGRAGRATKPGKVIVQTMANHSVFKYLDETLYLDFYDQEIEMRKLSGYPPFVRLVQLELQHEDGLLLDQESDALFDLLWRVNEQYGYKIILLGPARPVVFKILKTEIRHIFLKADSFSSVYKLLKVLAVFPHKSKIFVVPTT